jgi:hypothetical protein
MIIVIFIYKLNILNDDIINERKNIETNDKVNTLSVNIESFL